MTRKPFKHRSRCPRCNEGRQHTRTTFGGTPIEHTYFCGTTLANTGELQQSNRCKKRVQRTTNQEHR